MSLKSLFSNVWTWVKHAFDFLKKDADKVAIAITQDVNLALNSGLVDALVKALEPVTGHLPAEVIAYLKPIVPKVLAAELSLQGLPDNPTADELKAFADQVMEAFAKADLYKKTKVYTTVAADLYNGIQEAIKEDGKLSFFEIVNLVQKAFDTWSLQKVQNPDTTSMDALYQRDNMRVSSGIPVGEPLPGQNVPNDK